MNEEKNDFWKIENIGGPKTREIWRDRMRKERMRSLRWGIECEGKRIAVGSSRNRIAASERTIREVNYKVRGRVGIYSWTKGNHCGELESHRDFQQHHGQDWRLDVVFLSLLLRRQALAIALYLICIGQTLRFSIRSTLLVKTYRTLTFLFLMGVTDTFSSTWKLSLFLTLPPIHTSL